MLQALSDIDKKGIFSMNQKVVIIGASHPGHEAAIELLDRYQDLDVTIYEASDFVSFMSCGMKLFLEEKTTGQDNVRNFSPADLEKLGGKIVNNSQAVALNPANKQVTIKNTQTGQTEEVNYDKLILSPGVDPLQLPIPGADLDYVYLMRGYSWAKKINEALHNDEIKNIVVVGAGNGIAAVEAGVLAGKNMTLVDASNHILANYFSKDFTDVFEQEMRDKGVDLKLDTKVTGFTNDHLVQTDHGDIKADLVIVAAGIVANTDWLKDTINLNQRGYIETDEYLRTNQKDVYALGDAIWPLSIPANKRMPIPSAVAARHEANYLVQHLFEKKPSRPFPGLVGGQLLEFGDVHAVVSGLPQKSAEFAGINAATSIYIDHLRPDFIPADDNPLGYISLTYNKDTHQILGGAVMSKHDITAQGNVLSLAIGHKLTLEDLAEQDFFFSPSFDRQWNILNLAAQHALGLHKF